jgi:hypothetical protein
LIDTTGNLALVANDMTIILLLGKGIYISLILGLLRPKGRLIHDVNIPTHVHHLFQHLPFVVPKALVVNLLNLPSRSSAKKPYAR